MRPLAFELRRFAADERGIFGVIFAIMAVVLVAMSGAVVDFVTVEQARTRSQVALDAAALALQQKMSQTPRPTQTALQDQAQRLLEQQVNDPTIAATVTAVNPDFDTGTIDIQATIDVPTNFVRLVGVNHLQASLLSEATRGSTNLEVALALDVTGSMGYSTSSDEDDDSRTKIDDLIDATNELIDLVVKDAQEPAYTKMAFAPYSTAVNVGDYAEKVRGTVKPGEAISGAVWKGSSQSISGASQERPVKITTSNTLGVASGDWVTISGISGWGNMREINNKVFKVTDISGKTFKLQDANGNSIDGRYYDSYDGGGTVTKCQFPKCEVKVTVTNNTFTDGDYVYVDGITSNDGMDTALNRNTYVVGSRTASTFMLGGSVGRGTYSSGGTAWCAMQGCEYYYFKNVSGGYKTFQITDCATERTDHAYDDTAPSVTPLGRNYAGNGCNIPEIVPLTTDKPTLHAVANSLVANGSTAGHIGLAWAWYLVSPNFAYLWPDDSKPAAYDAPNVQKVVILMTDGAFNTVYCNGVVASNSISGSGGNSDHIDCPSPNGDIFVQAKAICEKMKNPDGNLPPVIVYTVGFDIGDDEDAKDVMASCATDAAHAYLANTGTELSDAFKAIGENITSLRVSR